MPIPPVLVIDDKTVAYKEAEDHPGRLVSAETLNINDEIFSYGPARKMLLGLDTPRDMAHVVVCQKSQSFHCFVFQSEIDRLAAAMLARIPANAA